MSTDQTNISSTQFINQDTLPEKGWGRKIKINPIGVIHAATIAPTTFKGSVTTET